MNRTSRIFYLMPMAHDVEPISIGLGLVHALQDKGIHVGFIKPISQFESNRTRIDLSTHFAKILCSIETNEPILFSHVQEKITDGDLSTLLEEIVDIVEESKNKYDVVLIEGLVPSGIYATVINFINREIARALSANPIFLFPFYNNVKELAKFINFNRKQFRDDNLEDPIGSIIINLSESNEILYDDLKNYVTDIIAFIPSNGIIESPRLLDYINNLNLEVICYGDLTRRIKHIVVADSTVEHVMKNLRPGSLIVTSENRKDIIQSINLKNLNISGLLFYSDINGSNSPKNFTHLKNIPILKSTMDLYDTITNLHNVNDHITIDDNNRVENIIKFISKRINIIPIQNKIFEETKLTISPILFRHHLVTMAKQANKKIVLPEGDEPRTLHAAVICNNKKIANCVLLGDPHKIYERADSLGLKLPDSIEIVDPEKVRERYVMPMVELRKSKGLTASQAIKQLEDNVVLGTMMVSQGDVDGLVSGAVHTTANTVRPALQLIKTIPGFDIVSSIFFMLMPNQVLVYGDCAINQNPTAEQLADIAIQSANSAKYFGIDPRIAMISYSTGNSGVGPDVDKVRKATHIVKQRHPDFAIEGPIQYDAAIVESVGKQKAPDSLVAGKANVFIFPDLNTGNTTYKAVQRSANILSIGPLLQGLRKPVNDLSRGALIDDIVYTIALTAIQSAQIN